MTLILDIPSEMQGRLAAEAARLGISIEEHVLRLLSTESSNGKPSTGEQLVNYWKSEGLIGTRSDIPDSQAHARALREQAERRTGS